MVLVDPPLGSEIRHVDKREARKITITEGDPATGFGMQYPSLTAKKALPEDIESWHTPEFSPSMESVFEQTLYAYSKGNHPTTDNPLSCTTVIRGIALSMWIGYLDRMRYILNHTHRHFHSHDILGLLQHDWVFRDALMLKTDLGYISIFLYRVPVLTLVLTEASSDALFSAHLEVDGWSTGPLIDSSTWPRQDQGITGQYLL